jgi:hypothetical protein
VVSSESLPVCISQGAHVQGSCGSDSWKKPIGPSVGPIPKKCRRCCPRTCSVKTPPRRPNMLVLSQGALYFEHSYCHATSGE